CAYWICSPAASTSFPGSQSNTPHDGFLCITSRSAADRIMIMQQQVANRGTQINLGGVPPIPAQATPLVASVPQREFDWLHFAARAGTNGHEWAGIYKSHAATVGLTQRALQLMWRHQVEQGRELLQQFTRAVRDVAIDPPSVAAAMQRLYYGSEAYYFYAVGRFDESYASLDSAHEAVVMAISSADF